MSINQEKEENVDKEQWRYKRGRGCIHTYTERQTDRQTDKMIKQKPLIFFSIDPSLL